MILGINLLGSFDYIVYYRNTFPLFHQGSRVDFEILFVTLKKKMNPHFLDQIFSSFGVKYMYKKSINIRS